MVAALLLVGSTVVAGSGASWAATSKEPPSSVGAATNVTITKAVASAKFVNQNGTPETLGALKGKTVFIIPFLTLCGDTCPFTTGNALQLQSEVNTAKDSNVVIVGIDVDPYRDTVARLKAYANLIGANFQLWAEAGSTTTPTLTPKEISSKNPVGRGDKNSNLTTIEKFLGWTVQVVPQSVPPANDWMAPRDQLSYDINHSDGFWIVNAQQQVRFASGDLPAFTGRLSKVLSTFMGYKSNIYNNPVYKGGWTPAEALQAITWVDSQSK
jgi:cytochrome oxidase Cu insertion factor (SCO1/SenC/PrrC family)